MADLFLAKGQHHQRAAVLFRVAEGLEAELGKAPAVTGRDQQGAAGMPLAQPVDAGLHQRACNAATPGMLGDSRQEQHMGERTTLPST